MIENPQRLVKVGPSNPGIGFPLWYKDSTGTRLELSLATADPFTPAVGDPEPFVSTRDGAPATLPEEAFYFLAEARIVTGGGVRPGRARVVLALEAAWGGAGSVADGQQVVFARLRVRVDGGVPGGLYTFTHPYGQTEPMPADERGRVFVTEDIGVAPLQFDGALSGHVAPFIRWTSGAAKAPGEVDPPPGYLGDGDTSHTITGSPLGFDFVRIEGPNIADAGGPRDPADLSNPNKVFTRLFTVQGRLATIAGVEVTRATYRRTAAGAVTLDVFAGSEPGQALTANLAGLPNTPLSAAGGNYYAAVAAGTTVPPSVAVVNVTDAPPSAVTVPVTDAVDINQADFEPGPATLTVAAISSDAVATPTLTVAGPNLPDFPIGTVTVAAPPAVVTVRSSLGGSAGREVRSTG